MNSNAKIIILLIILIIIVVMNNNSNENFIHLSDNYAGVNYNTRIEDGVETVIPHVKNMCKNKKYNNLHQNINEGFNNYSNINKDSMNISIRETKSPIKKSKTTSFAIPHELEESIDGEISNTNHNNVNLINNVSKIIADVNDDCDVRERYLARNLKLNQTIPKPNIINNIENIVDSVNNNKNRNDNQLYDDIDVKSLNSMMSADDNNSLNDIYSDLLTLN